MAKAKNKILKVILTIFAVIIVLLVVVIALIDPIAETVANQIAPRVLGVPVQLESVHISLFKGRVELQNFAVGNPEGYASDHSIKIDKVIADIEPKSLFSDKIHIEEIVLHGLNVNYETALVKSNLQDIVNSLKGDSTETAEKKPVETKSKNNATEEETPAKKLQIDKIEFEDVGVTVLAKGVATGVPLHVSMDPIGPFGEDEAGISPVALSGHIVGAILLTSLKRGGEVTGDAIKNVGDAAATAGAGILTGLKNMINGEKQEENVKKDMDSIDNATKN